MYTDKKNVFLKTYPKLNGREIIRIFFSKHMVALN